MPGDAFTPASLIKPAAPEPKTPIKMLLTGAMGSGKSFGSAYMAREHAAVRWSRTELMKKLAHAIADRIGDADSLLERVFPDADEREAVREALIQYVTHEYREEPGKPRRLYQDITQICQDQDPLCFERELAERIDRVGEVELSLIDDVRSPEAFEFFAERGYVTVRIDADEKIRRERMLARDGYLPSEETFRHPSETALQETPHQYHLDNSTDDPAHLYRVLDELIAELRGGGAA